MQFITEHTVREYAVLCARQSLLMLQHADILLRGVQHSTTDSEHTFCQCSCSIHLLSAELFPGSFHNNW